MAPPGPPPKSLKKYDVPLFCASWVPLASSLKSGEKVEETQEAGSEEKKDIPGEEISSSSSDMFVVFGGGGGDGNHGIRNRTLLAKYKPEDDELTEPVCHVATDDDVPYRIAVHPSGEVIVIAYDKSCRLYDVKKSAEGEPFFSDRPSIVLNALEEQKFLTFSPEGTRLAVGGESKKLTVYEWPSLKVVLEKEDAHDAALKDADFSVSGDLLATTADDGPARVWDLSKSSAVARLSPSQAAGGGVRKGAGGRVGLCRFSRDPALSLLYTTLMKEGRGYVVTWNTSTWERAREVRLCAEPISCLAVSPDGALLALGTAGGDVALVDARKLSTGHQLKGAHMIFVTAVTFSGDSRHLLSVSGDSSAKVTQTAVARNKNDNTMLLFLVFLLLLAVLATLLFPPLREVSPMVKET